MSGPATEYRPDLVGDGWDPEPLLSAKDVAAILGVRRSRVYELSIPRVRVSRKCLRWRPRDVREFLERRTEEG